MRKASDSTQLIRLRREMKLIHQDRQAWGARAVKAERELAKAQQDVAEWKARFDKLLSREPEGPR